MSRELFLRAAMAAALCVGLPGLCMAWPTDSKLAAWVPYSGSEQVLTSAVSDGAGGVLVAAYNYAVNGPNVQHLLASGIRDPSWPEIGVVPGLPVFSQSPPLMVSDGAGGVIIASSNRVHHVLGSGQLDPVWPAGGLTLPLSTGLHACSILSDGAGGAFVLLVGDGGDFLNLYRVLASGTADPAWPTGGLSSFCGGIPGQGVLATDGAGGVLIAWRDRAGSLFDIYAQHVRANGTVDPAWPALGTPVCTATGAQSSPQIVSDGAGGAVVVWNDGRATRPLNYAQRVGANGAVDPAWPVNGRALAVPGDPYHKAPKAVADGTGGALVVWTDIFDLREYIQHVTGSGVVDPAWPASGRMLSPVRGDNPNLIADGSGGAFVTWWQDTQQNFNPNDVYVHHVLASGALDPLWPAGGRGVSTLDLPGPGPTTIGDGTGTPALVPDGAGGAIVAWWDRRGNISYSVYAGRVTWSSALGVNLADDQTPHTGVFRGASAWGDYDGDGDLDLLTAGVDGGSSIHLERNDGGTWTSVPTALPGLEWCSLAWGDYDGDSDLDLALCGYSNGPLISRIYRNDGGAGFTDLGAGLPGVIAGAVAWADYDNDGDLDLLLAGQDVTAVPIARLYRNDGGTFVDSGTPLTGVYFCDAAWGDHDADGDLDLVLAGYAGSNASTRLYRNDAGTLLDSGLSLPGVWEGDVAWGDRGGDGDLDLLLLGWDGAVRRTDVALNSGGALSSAPTGLPGLSSSAGAWGDFDNDGDLDVVVSGYAGSARTLIGRVDQGAFVDGSAALPGLYYSSVAWGDADGDGDLDLALSGLSDFSGALTRLHLSEGADPNQPPGPPGGLSAQRNGADVTFGWSPASDDHTPSASLSYNLRVGTTPGGDQIMAGMAAADGHRRVARLGNAGNRTSWTLHLPPGTYYWGVQAIDGAYLGSAFSSMVTVVGVEDEAPGTLVPGLEPARPNPFDRSTSLRFTLARMQRIEADVVDLAGRRVRTLLRGNERPGRHGLTWDGRDDAGVRLASGLYFVRVRADETEWTRRVVLAR